MVRYNIPIVVIVFNNGGMYTYAFIYIFILKILIMFKYVDNMNLSTKDTYYV
jgi:hypothetical protein